MICRTLFSLHKQNEVVSGTNGSRRTVGTEIPKCWTPNGGASGPLQITLPGVSRPHYRLGRTSFFVPLGSMARTDARAERRYWTRLTGDGYEKSLLDTKTLIYSVYR